jgi:hypothetical protein
VTVVDHQQTRYGSIANFATFDIGTRSIFPLLRITTIKPFSISTLRTVAIGRSIRVPSFSSMIK